jgi:putative ABC transport system substrate-binding protein
MRRRDFITLLGIAAAAGPLAARAQQGKPPMIGTLYPASALEWAPYMDGFRRGLGEAGFIEGRNVNIEYRWAEHRIGQLPELAADLVKRNVAVILAGGGSVAIRAAMAATQTIPIVFTTGTDPVANGLVASLNRPGGNATGVTWIASELIPKRFELLHEVLPAATKIAMLLDAQEDPTTARENTQGIQEAARRLGLEITGFKCGTEAEIEMAFEAAVAQGVAAVYAGVSAFIVSKREQIAALALRHKLPTMSEGRDAVVAGQLIGYASRLEEGYREAGRYVGRILKGEKPADLPVTRPTKLELVINLKTAKALGLTIPPTLLTLADEVIE